MKKISLITAMVGVSGYLLAQNPVTQDKRAEQVQLNAITTAVPFLNIAPDSRSAAMGDAGVALSPDANSIHWNAAKLAFVEEDVQLSLSYSPWLRSLVPDMNISYVSGYKRINEISTVGGSLRYFSLGEITFTDAVGNELRTFTPNEFALDGAYALQLSKRLSAGVALRYVRSNLTSGSVTPGQDNRPGQSVAFDMSAYYKTGKFEIAEKDAYLTAGVNISNIGNKMSYSTSAEEDFLPSNLRLGPALQVNLDEYNTVSFTVEATKLLVPTPGGDLADTVSGKKVSVLEGVFGSFGDAPGGGQEELREINLAFGAEYLYNNQLAFRMGYFHEHETKGNRKFITLGAGLKYTIFEVDLAYLIATSQNSPLANTLRITLQLTFNKDNNNQEEEGI